MLIRPSIASDYKAGYIQGFTTITNARKLKKATKTVSDFDKSQRERELQQIKGDSRERGKGR